MILPCARSCARSPRGQSQITDASHLVVFTTRTDMTEADVGRFHDFPANIEERDPQSLSGYRNVSPASRQP